MWVCLILTEGNVNLNVGQHPGHIDLRRTTEAHPGESTHTASESDTPGRSSYKGCREVGYNRQIHFH